MTSEEFNKVFEERIEKCRNVLCTKSEEYATASDRLHNFKVAAVVQGCESVKALGGMMAKHTVSVYDLIEKYNDGLAIPKELWDEKIGDSINYLILLTALIEEEAKEESELMDKLEE